ncbi:MAG: hypothetical protein SFY66_13835 [Oculatellaceae cyanobacterium bins.114]|nr:hypothetical protein [Oculatellaceae cyanobacterium bins.114]
MMTNAKEQLIQELDQTPDFIVQEVLNFLLFIKVRLKQANRDSQLSTVQQPSELPPFLQFVGEISAQIPEEEWKKMPSDLSKNLDHYLYQF